MLSTVDVFTKIKYALNNKTPFSLVRLGDQEALILDNKNQSKIESRYKDHLGYLPNRTQQQEIRQYLIKAYEGADITGFPDLQHQSRNEWWNQAEQILVDNAKVDTFKCSMNIHLDLLKENFLKELIRLQNIFYISSHNIDRGLSPKFLSTINSYQIPPEHKYFKLNNQMTHYYPEVFNRVCDWIRQQDCKGKLCLVGGGFIGKYFCQLFKEQGGIAIDLGSVFDLWAGYKTRGTGGKLIEDNTYKL